MDLETQQSLSGVHINWGDTPARSFEVKIGNDSTTFNSVLSMDVEISAVYNATLANIVDLLLGNITTANFSSSTVGRYGLLFFLLMIGMCN